MNQRQEIIIRKASSLGTPSAGLVIADENNLPITSFLRQTLAEPIVFEDGAQTMSGKGSAKHDKGSNALYTQGIFPAEIESFYTRDREDLKIDLEPLKDNVIDELHGRKILTPRYTYEQEVEISGKILEKFSRRFFAGQDKVAQSVQDRSNSRDHEDLRYTRIADLVAVAQGAAQATLGSSLDMTLGASDMFARTAFRFSSSHPILKNNQLTFPFDRTGFIEWRTRQGLQTTSDEGLLRILK